MIPQRLTFQPFTIVVALAVATVSLLWSAQPAFAYNETGTVDPTITDCAICHDNEPVYESAPHRGYLTTTSRCKACHSVHEAPAASVMLLSSGVVKQTCLACHDGTGGRGVYGALEAHGVSPVARHRVDTTSSIPGGNFSTGETRTASFSGTGGTMSCIDCHSPHGANTVADFRGDRARAATDTAQDFDSNRLLRTHPRGGETTVAVYGSDWCGSCHRGRLTGTTGVHNHPVDSDEATTGTFFTYNNVARLNTSVSTSMGPMGRSNRGYLMPFPRTGHQTGHKPICQQCHEDARSVGTTNSPVEFSVTSVDGVNSADNPQFQVFPHEAASEAFLVETGENLCTNCHEAGSQLP